jgi:hypothetical protein
MLAFELRQNNELLQAEASVAYVELRNNSLMDIAQSDGLLNALVRAGEGADLAKIDTLRLEMFYRSVFVNWEWEFEQYSFGGARSS